uniref:Uncharacterized protein n=1 Tax=Arundo donax TaxID=35708 RepID=A0A0A9BIF5_ARUDO
MKENIHPKTIIIHCETQTLTDLSIPRYNSK